MPLLKNFKKLNASSVMESVIAISIISVCALIAFTIYLNIIRQHKPIYYFNVKHKIDQLTQRTIEHKDYENNRYSYNGHTIHKEVNINISDRTARLTFTYTLRGKINEVNKLVSYDEE